LKLLKQPVETAGSTMSLQPMAETLKVTSRATAAAVMLLGIVFLFQIEILNKKTKA